jgi:ATP-binding cassette, subfamily C, bacterial
MKIMKYHNVLQHSEEDCGAACLATVAKHYGRIFSINRIREVVGTGQLGTSLLGLIRGAETLGFNARGVKAHSDILDALNKLPLPAIIHWQGYHYVVFYGVQGQKYIIADPSVGICYLSREELLENWTQGVTLLLEVDPVRFYAQENDTISGFGRFLKPILNYRGVLGEALLMNVVLGVFSLALPFLVQILTDDVLVRGDRPLLMSIAIAAIAMQVMGSSLELLQFNLIAHFAQRLELGLVMEFGRKILRLPLAYFESHRSGEIVSRLRDIQDINRLISQVAVSWPSQLFIAIVSFGFMLFYSSQLVLIALMIAGLMVLSTILLWSKLRQSIRNLLVLEAENQGVLVETFKGALTVKTTTAAPQFWEEFQGRFGRLANITFRTIQINIINRTFSMWFSNLGDIIILWVGSGLVINHELSIGQLLAFKAMNDNFLNFIGFVIRFANEYIRTNAAVSRLAEVIDSTPETQDDVQKAWVTINDNADIICTNLQFHHSGRTDLLTDFSLTIPGGKVTALIGKSGCGKSTLAKLVASLYPLQSGNIRIDKYILQDLSLDCLRQQIILIPQEPHFWSRSIVENFRLGSPNITFEQIVDACQIAEADEFISKLPDRYQTVLGEFGANISGGQRQRLAIARAIVSNPPILILDESTAGLDPVSEAHILDRLLAHRQGKTTLLISHRPRVIQRADRIILLDRGQLVLEGPLDHLRRKPGEHLEFLTP